MNYLLIKNFERCSLFALKLETTIETLDLLDEEFLGIMSPKFEGRCEDLVFGTERDRREVYLLRDLKSEEAGFSRF